jgi:HEPN domain-containing protein
MSDFTKNKISFALALLGTLFALSPFLEKIVPPEHEGFVFLNLDLKWYYAFGLAGGLLALSVYCYAMAIVTERSSTLMEKLGNYCYAIAVMVLPLYGGLYVSHVIAKELLGEPGLAWVAPTVAGGFAFLWVLLAGLLRHRLAQRDRVSKIAQLGEQEIHALGRAREMFQAHHYDLSVIEAWRAIEARLRRVLLSRRITPPQDNPQKMIEIANRRGLVNDAGMESLREVRRQWNVAVSTEPLTQEAAELALGAARKIIATLPVEEVAAGEVASKRV